jgi:hypothetical protein
MEPSETQGRGNTTAGECTPDALDALSAPAVTQHGEPVGTPSPAESLSAALEALGRDGEITPERLREVEGLVRDALRALADARAP